MPSNRERACALRSEITRRLYHPRSSRTRASQSAAQVYLGAVWWPGGGLLASRPRDRHRRQLPSRVAHRIHARTPPGLLSYTGIQWTTSPIASFTSSPSSRRLLLG